MFVEMRAYLRRCNCNSTRNSLAGGQNICQISVRMTRNFGLKHIPDSASELQGLFEQPDRVAYAILLVPKSGLMASYKIVVLSKVSDEYAVRLLDHARGSTYSGPGLVISKEAHRKYSDFGGTESVRLKLDALNVEWLEKGSVLYYWSRGRYRSIQTSD